MKENLLTVDEIAERLRVSRVTVHNWITEGRIAYLKLGPRCFRFKESDVVKFEEKSLIPSLK